MAIMISNALSYQGADIKVLENVPELEGYDEVSKWSKDAVSNLIDIGFITGKQKGNTLHIAPKDKLTRAEGIILLRRLLIQ
jgi:hypothetical protein